MEKSLALYRHENGLLTQANNDGGDTCNRTMAANCYYMALGAEKDDLGRYLHTEYTLTLVSLSDVSKPGRYRRHPVQYPNIDNFTRDQSIVLQSAMVMYDDRKSMLDLVKARAKRLFFHFNTQDEEVTAKFPDPPSPIEFSQFIRGLNLWPLYPLLLVLDLQLVVDLLVVRPIMKREGNLDFDVQYLPIILSCLYKYKTPWTALAKRVYSRTETVESELRRYFSEADGRNGLEPLGELACKTYKTVIKGEKK